MGYEIVLFACVACDAQDSGNAALVPSIRVKRGSDGQIYVSPEGRREPICRRCSAKMNENRVAAGMEPFFIHPDAYEPRQVT